MLNRTDAILAGFTSVAVVTICFLTYQILKEPEPKVTKVQPTRSVVTPLAKPETKKRTHSQQIRKKPHALKPAVANLSDIQQHSKPAGALLIGTTPTTPKVDKQISRLNEGTPSSIPTLADIHFDFNKGELPENAQTQLRNHAEILKSGKWEVLIQGHTDHRGSTRFNLRVGQKRAEAVKDYLTTLDVPKGHMHVVTLGEFNQICKQDTEACADANRRVGFTLIKSDTTSSEQVNKEREAQGNEEDRVQAQDSMEPKEEEKKMGSPS